MAEIDIKSTLRHDVSVSPTARRTLRSLSGSGREQPPVDGELLELARRIMKARSRIGDFVPHNLLKDWAWDILFELFVNGEEGGIVYVKHLMLSCNTTPTSAMRIIDRLDDANLLRREVDELDHRRVIVSLTPHGRKFILALLETIGERDEEESGHRGNLAPRPYRPRG
ncbi:MarR family winged helix-turn-helix transcriptional regulator [Pelagerythrobacter marinus]|uniref:MarR family winged helix-turn-helix transcriptional regulator n=1 Tax=Pelagerythrobacter marinus TaxID=538382 RepID=UPI002036EB76|nr:hypothetical protein [Pelagerythrobacter marinus]USA38515.1 hypothetical protein NCF86_09240 [Pelagerythrobacter marinus]WPZ07460.1 hypothetical protein T8T98_02805 [Pelagerythrobacter marinus]